MGSMWFCHCRRPYQSYNKTHIKRHFTRPIYLVSADTAESTVSSFDKFVKSPFEGAARFKKIQSGFLWDLGDVLYRFHVKLSFTYIYLGSEWSKTKCPKSMRFRNWIRIGIWPVDFGIEDLDPYEVARICIHCL